MLCGSKPKWKLIREFIGMMLVSGAKVVQLAPAEGVSGCFCGGHTGTAQACHEMLFRIACTRDVEKIQFPLFTAREREAHPLFERNEADWWSAFSRGVTPATQLLKSDDFVQGSPMTAIAEPGS